MTLDQLEYLIEKNSLTYCKVFLGDNLLNKIDARDPQELIESLREFCDKINTGTYKIDLLVNKRNTHAEAFSVELKVKGSSVAIVQDDKQNSYTTDFISVADMEKKLKEHGDLIVQKIADEHKQREREQAHKEREKSLKEREDKLETIGGKATFIADVVINNLIQKYMPLMQGIMGQNQMEMETANLQGASTSTMTDQDKIDEGLQYLSEAGVTPDIFIEFSILIKEKPILVKFLPKLKDIVPMIEAGLIKL